MTDTACRLHVLSIFDATAAERADMWDLLHAVRRSVPDADGWNIGINDGTAAGRAVHHLHIHAIPRRYDDQADQRGGIRRGLPNGDPDRWVR